jgi:hypothetical protein
MTASLISFQGFTYKMTRVTLSICLTSGVHLTHLIWTGMIPVKPFGILVERWGEG